MSNHAPRLAARSKEFGFSRVEHLEGSNCSLKHTPARAGTLCSCITGPCVSSNLDLISVNLL